MDLKGVEIFATGRWNDIKTFSDADLDAMAASFAELSLTGRVPLKFGHNGEQPLTDGQPALGWVSRVYRDGDKLLADFTAMPRVVYDAVKAGLYKFVSVELLRDVVFQGSEFPWVLSAVALLGADIPAVSGLKDLQALALTRRAEFRSGARLTFTRDVSTSTGDRNPMGDEKKDLEAMSARLDALAGKLETFSKDNARLTAENERLKSEADSREKAIRAEKVTAHRAAIALRFESAIKGKVISAQARTLFEKGAAFKSDDTVTSISLDEVDAFIKEHTVPGAKFSERKAGDPGSDSRGEDTDEVLAADDSVPAVSHVMRLTNDTLANDQRFKGKSYFEANQHVLRTYPKLADKYRYEPGTTGGRS